MSYETTLADAMDAAGVRGYPLWFEKVGLLEAPMPHQIEMVKLYCSNQRYLDAGDPGVGKSLAAYLQGALMAGLGNKVVYTMPPKLIDQFVEELGKWLRHIDGYLKVGRLDGTVSQKELLRKQWDREGWPDILVLSYDGYREWNDVSKEKKVGSNRWYDGLGNRVADPATYKGDVFTKQGAKVNKRGYAENEKHLLLTKQGYNVFFFDEAQALCGIDSIISKSVHDAAQRDSAIYLMTGTPVPTDIIDAYGIIRLINPEAYPSFASFERQHIIKKPIHVRGRRGLRVVKVPSRYVNTDKIYTELFRYARRIQKREIVKLAEPLITDVKVRLEGKHMKLYKEFMASHFAVIGNTVLTPETQQEARHMSLKLISCPDAFDPSIPMENSLYEAFTGLLDSINPRNHKVVVFAYYRAVVEFLSEKLKDFNPAVIYGGTDDPGAQVSKFKNDESCRLIILNWKSGGAGLNLQNASHIVFYECPTSATDAKQGIARCDRTGQLETVNVYVMRVLNTLSDRNFKKLLKSEDSINSVVRDDLDLLHEVLAA